MEDRPFSHLKKKEQIFLKLICRRFFPSLSKSVPFITVFFSAESKHEITSSVNIEYSGSRVV